MTLKRKSTRGDIEMMGNPTVETERLHTVNLAEIEGEGSFSCPKCGTMISPDDETEEVYQIIDTKVVNGELAELVISCITCRKIIRLIGFQQIEGLINE